MKKEIIKSNRGRKPIDVMERKTQIMITIPLKYIDNVALLSAPARLNYFTEAVKSKRMALVLQKILEK